MSLFPFSVGLHNSSGNFPLAAAFGIGGPSAASTIFPPSPSPDHLEIDLSLPITSTYLRRLKVSSYNQKFVLLSIKSFLSNFVRKIVCFLGKRTKFST
jgi:hypothetical protein